MEREMKDSGVEWIGKIPSEWSCSKIKYMSTISSGTAISKEEYEENGFFPIYGANGVVGWCNKKNNNNECLVTGRVGSIGFIHKASEAWITDNALIILTSSETKDFLYYAMMLLDYNQMISGTAMPLITAGNLYKQIIPTTTNSEMKRIASFLDTKCAEIDKAIEATKSSIEEYKKLRQAIITEAVTKGLDPNVEMKDSGVEWIGKIPSKWNVKKLRFLGFCQNGISKGAEFFGDEGFPFVSYSDVYKNIHLPISLGKINSSKEEQKLYSVKKGDIFFTRTSETIEEIGFSSVCLETIPEATFAGFLIRVRPTTGELNERFSSYYFRSDIHRLYFIKEMNLVTRASLGQTLLKNLPVLIPPINEQVYIADFLDTKCAEIDSLIKSKEKLIEELTVYRKSLIFEYVTGKKEVPAV